MKNKKAIKLSFDSKQLVLLLLQEGIRARKLYRGLATVAELNPKLQPDFSYPVLAAMGFEKPTDEAYKLYFELVDRYSENVAIDNDALHDAARELYNELIEKASG